jgi:phosphopantothenoylcysteine decarboxylase
MTSGVASGVIHLVASAAPPVLALDELVALLQADRWDVYVIATPTAATWIDSDGVRDRIHVPIRSRQRLPHEPGRLPPADVVVVVPATFNLLNKWVAGISDDVALGTLNEAVGAGLPIVVAPYMKASLAAHPTLVGNLRTLASWGVTVTPIEGIRPPASAESYQWHVVMSALSDIRGSQLPGHGRA